MFSMLQKHTIANAIGPIAGQLNNTYVTFLDQCGVAGLADSITNSVKLKLELRLSLAISFSISVMSWLKVIRIGEELT